MQNSTLMAAEAVETALNAQFGDQWFRSLSGLQKETVLTYRTPAGYRAINAWLRNEGCSNATSQASLMWAIVHALESAMLPVAQRLVTFRGFNGLGSPFAEDSETFIAPTKLVGTTFVDKGFVSTVPYEDLAENCARFGVTNDARRSELPVKLTIDVPAGIPAVFLGNFVYKHPEMPELILARDLRYQVLRANFKQPIDAGLRMLEVYVGIVETGRALADGFESVGGNP